MSVANSTFDNIKAIVFDLDDTLYPQIEYKRSGFRVVSAWLAAQHDCDQPTTLTTLEDILEQYGAAYPLMFDRLAERLEMQQALVPEMVGVFIEHEPQIACYDGVLPMLARLRAKYKLGILTDGRLSVQQKKIAALGLFNKFDYILCSDSLKLEKPSEQLYAWLENKFHMVGMELLYVGDNPSKDFCGATRRGWFNVQVMTGESEEDDRPSSFHAKHKIPSVVDLEEMLVS